MDKLRRVRGAGPEGAHRGSSIQEARRGSSRHIHFGLGLFVPGEANGRSDLAQV
jgi:hypothetical protein